MIFYLDKWQNIFNWQNPIYFERKKSEDSETYVSTVIRLLKSCTFSFCSKGLSILKSKPPKGTTTCFSMLLGSFSLCEHLWRIDAIAKKGAVLVCFLVFGIFSNLTSRQNSGSAEMSSYSRADLQSCRIF